MRAVVDEQGVLGWSADRPVVSILVPTRNEEGNIRRVVGGLDLALAAFDFEIVVIDDSDDATPEVLRALQAEYPRLVVEHRGKESRRGGLAGAVSAGFRLARGEVLVVMDGDMQHPPPSACQLASAVLVTSAEIAIGSRYAPGGSYSGLGSGRRVLVSKGARGLARSALPRIRSVRDPLAGFFALRRSVVEGVSFDDVEGFKILLEVLVRGRWSRLVEVPVDFGPRMSGDSKATASEGMRLVRQVARLGLHREMTWSPPQGPAVPA
jgi:dolichol-phosphate mannosyltransferase